MNHEERIEAARKQHERVVEKLQPRLADSAGYWAPEGWSYLIDKLDNALAAEYPDYQISQTKEKFGGLRYYVRNVGESGHKIIREAENLSYEICQSCGTEENVGSVDSGWVATLCRECAEAEQAARGYPTH